MAVGGKKGTPRTDTRTLHVGEQGVGHHSGRSATTGSEQSVARASSWEAKYPELAEQLKESEDWDRPISVGTPGWRQRKRDIENLGLMLAAMPPSDMDALLAKLSSRQETRAGESIAAFNAKWAELPPVDRRAWLYSCGIKEEFAGNLESGFISPVAGLRPDARCGSPAYGMQTPSVGTPDSRASSSSTMTRPSAIRGY